MIVFSDSYRGYDLQAVPQVGVRVYFQGEYVTTYDTYAEAYTQIDSWLNAP